MLPQFASCFVESARNCCGIFLANDSVYGEVDDLETLREWRGNNFIEMVVSVGKETMGLLF